VDAWRPLVRRPAGGAAALTVRRRRPWLAAALSLGVIGLGDAYNGRIAKGAVLAGAKVGLGLAWLTAVVLSGGARAVLAAGVVGTLAITLFAAIRAFRDARALGDGAPPRRWVHVVAFVAVALAVDVPLGEIAKERIIRSWRVPSQSMLPTLEVGDHVFTEAWAYGRFGASTGPKPGDVIVFTFPKDRSKEFIKRVVATAGQTVELYGPKLLVDGKPREEPYARYVRGDGNFKPITVPDGHVFVLGDNRDESYDSRFWGSVPIEHVRGRVGAIYWSWDGGRNVRWDRIGRRVE
jgi:signal peptidase I